MTAPATTRSDSRAGLAALALSVLLCGSAHLLLRHGATELSVNLLPNWRLALGLATYGCGTLLWLHCLSKLDLAVAFPASAVQLVLVLAGAHWLLGEVISVWQMVGAAVILIGIAMLFIERRGRHA